MEINLDEAWKQFLNDELLSDNFNSLTHYLDQKIRVGELFYPACNQIFNAFNLTPLKDVKVVILGQDPYHGDGQAMGLSFSVPDGIKLPPSLKNIIKEIENDLGIKMSGSGNLEPWAKQGVLLLNSILTVEPGKPGSHSNIGWQIFTDSVIKKLSDNKSEMVFLLWGNYAKGKVGLIDGNKHLILQSAHPSPLARGAFFGCKHFSQTNSFLEINGNRPIEWGL